MTTPDIKKILDEGLPAVNSSPAELARFLDVSPQTVNNWKTRNSISKDYVYQVAEYLGIDPSKITGKANQPIPPPRVELSEVVMIPAYFATADAGPGFVNYTENEVPGGFAFKRRSITSRGLPINRLCCIFAKGQSMEPAIEDGDMIVMQLGVENVIAGEIYVIRLFDELRVKRVLKEDANGKLMLRLQSDNADKTKFPDEIINPESDGFEIIGKVEWRGGWI